MHRSGNTARSADGRFLWAEMDCLPIYDPQSEIARKEVARIRSTEKMIHLIPLILIFSAAVLWFFSHPVSREQLKAVKEDESIASRSKKTVPDYYMNLNDLDATDGNETEKAGISVDEQVDEIEEEKIDQGRRDNNADGIGAEEIGSEQDEDSNEDSFATEETARSFDDLEDEIKYGDEESEQEKQMSNAAEGTLDDEEYGIITEELEDIDGIDTRKTNKEDQINLEEAAVSVDHKEDEISMEELERIRKMVMELKKPKLRSKLKLEMGPKKLKPRRNRGKHG